MGNLFDSGVKSKILIVGLDNSGKSTLINFLKPKAMQQSELAATVGFKVENFKKGSINFTVFDMSG